MKTWRHFVNLPLSQFYRISTDNARAVLPRLRRRAGQRLGLRSVAHDEPRRHPHQRLVQRRRRRRLPGARRSRGSEHRLRAVAGRGHDAPRSAHRPERRCASALEQHVGLSPADLETETWTNRNATPFVAGGDAAAAPQGRGGRGGGGGGGRGGGAAALGRWHWDAPFIISPHAARRLYVGGDRVYRSDDRGDTWTAISPDLTRNLDRTEDPDHGQGVAGRLGRLHGSDDQAQHDHRARRVAAARRTALRRDRRRIDPGDGGRRQEPGARPTRSRASRNSPT